MQLVRATARPRRHLAAALAQITGVSTWVVVALWGAGQIATRAMCVYGESKLEVAQTMVRELALDAYPQWLRDHPGLHCPPALGELVRYIDLRDTKDPWGNSYIITCPPAVGPVIVSSAGEDGRFGTVDDLRSDLR
jgi:hypothetical protein